MISGPQEDASKSTGNQGLAQYSRAIHEALKIAARLNVLIDLPMYREPDSAQPPSTLSSLSQEAPTQPEKDIDIWTSWDTWNQTRSVCSYDLRLYLCKSSFPNGPVCRL